ncbi:hypothetical protein BLOT_010208 [Blomia tropicalis]|nr:hypothetical protein BLOT_010208 [Blomia tropicalis]
MLFMTMTSIEMKSINEDSSSDDSDGSMSDEEMNRQIRRSEISRALGLLKKHSVVGKDAKIVLKSNGKPHLLVDPTESLLLVSSHSHQQNNMINTKANKLQLKKQTSASNGTNKKKDSLRNKSASIGVQTKRQNNGKVQ